jgi:hypothetical protein
VFVAVGSGGVVTVGSGEFVAVGSAGVWVAVGALATGTAVAGSVTPLQAANKTAISRTGYLSFSNEKIPLKVDSFAFDRYSNTKTLQNSCSFLQLAHLRYFLISLSVALSTYIASRSQVTSLTCLNLREL